MRNTITTLLFCLLANFAFSQVITIYDETRQEVHGYAIFEKLERIKKRENLYMISFYDVNINPVSQMTFKDHSGSKIGNVHYSAETIYFEMVNTNKPFSRSQIPSNVYSYRLYDLKQNKISDRYELPVKHKKTFIEGRYSIPGKGFGIMIRDYAKSTNRVYAITNQNEVLYDTYLYDNSKKKRNSLRIRIQDQNEGTLANIISNFPNKKSKHPTYYVQLMNINNGKVINEINLDTEDYKTFLNNAQFNDGYLKVFGDTYRLNKSISSGKTSGMMRAEISPEGEVVSQKALTWEDLQSKIDIREGGRVKGKGYIFTHDYVYDKSTKHTIVVGEYLYGDPLGVSTENMVFLDFDQDFNLTQTYEVKTKQARLHTGLLKNFDSRKYGFTLNSHGYFDYRFQVFLENNDGLAFTYFDLERSGLFSDKFTHGIVVYKNGKFTDNKLTWERRNTKENAAILPSKPGYILISERSKDLKVENRLERIGF